MAEIFYLPSSDERCRYCLDYTPEDPNVCHSPEPPHWVQRWDYNYLACGFRPDLNKLKHIPEV